MFLRLNTHNIMKKLTLVSFRAGNFYFTGFLMLDAQKPVIDIEAVMKNFNRRLSSHATVSMF